jgi:hypothetical protein
VLLKGQLPVYVLLKGQLPAYVLLKGQLPAYVLLKGQLPVYVLLKGQLPVYVLLKGQLPVYVLLKGQLPVYVLLKSGMYKRSITCKKCILTSDLWNYYIIIMIVTAYITYNWNIVESGIKHYAVSFIHSAIFQL